MAPCGTIQAINIRLQSIIRAKDLTKFSWVFCSILFLMIQKGVGKTPDTGDNN